MARTMSAAGLARVSLCRYATTLDTGVFVDRASVTEPGAVEEADKEDMGLEGQMAQTVAGETRCQMVPSSKIFQNFH